MEEWPGESEGADGCAGVAGASAWRRWAARLPGLVKPDPRIATVTMVAVAVIRHGGLTLHIG